MILGQQRCRLPVHSVGESRMSNHSGCRALERRALRRSLYPLSPSRWNENSTTSSWTTRPRCGASASSTNYGPDFLVDRFKGMTSGPRAIAVGLVLHPPDLASRPNHSDERQPFVPPGRPTAMFCRERVQGDLPHRVPDLDLGPLGVWDGRGRRSAAGHLHARLARILIARRLVPLLPHRAPTHHLTR